MNLIHPKAASTNICINCKHHHHDGSEKFADRCLRTDNGINPVNGQIISRSCDNERFSSHGKTCGPAGIYFAPRINQEESDDFSDWFSRNTFKIVDLVFASYYQDSKKKLK